MNEQSIHVGAGVLPKLGADLDQNPSLTSVLIVHGKGSYRSSGAQDILSAVFASRKHVSVAHFDDIRPNPDLSSVLAAAEIFRSEQPDMVVAVGGGSVIDTAKAMMAAGASPDTASFLKSDFEIPADRPRFVAVPTTAGSGSEATHFAVMYNEGKKYSLAHSLLRPDIVYLDPVLTLSCPKDLTLAAGADALCQSVESWWSRGATAVSRTVAKRAIEPITKTLLKAADDPDDLEARSKILLAAHDAGQAINISKTTAGHALSYGLTSRFGIPHGIAVLLVMRALVKDMAEQGDLPTDMDEFLPVFGERFRVVADSVLGGVSEWLSPVLDPVSQTIVDALVEGVNLQRLSNHPVHLSVERISRLYTSALLL